LINKQKNIVLFLNFCWHNFFIRNDKIKNGNMKKQTEPTQDNKANRSTEEISKEYEQLKKDAEHDTKPRKPGSQSNSSGQHNNGRGGGK